MARLAKLQKNNKRWQVFSKETGEIFGQYMQHKRCITLRDELVKFGIVEKKSELLIASWPVSTYDASSGICSKYYKIQMRDLRQKAGV